MVLATVHLRDGESQENLLKRFRKQVMKERILSEARRKRWYISPSEMRRIERQRAIRRARRKLGSENHGNQDSGGSRR